MLLTLYYMATAWFQYWRLNSLKSSFAQLLNKNATLVLYKENVTVIDGSIDGTRQSHLTIRTATSDCCVNRKEAHLSDFVYYANGKRVVSLFPLQILDVNNWINIGEEDFHIPIHMERSKSVMDESSKLHLLIEANFQACESRSQYCLCNLPDFGKPKAWTAGDNFHVLLETDLDHFVQLGKEFMCKNLCFDNAMEIIRLECVYVTGCPWDLLNSSVVSMTIAPTTFVPVETSLPVDEMDNNIYAAPLCAKQAALLREIAGMVPSSEKTDDIQLPNYRSAALKKSEKPINDDANNTAVGNCKGRLSSGGSWSEGMSLLAEAGSLPCSFSQGSCDTSRDLAGPEQNDSFDALDHAANCSSEDEARVSDTDIFAEVKPRNLQKKVSRVHHSGEQKTGKPPNIIVFSESVVFADNIKEVLNTLLEKHRYTTYTLTLNEMLNSPWCDQASLVVVCGNVPFSLKPLLVSYVLKGGHMLCLCSDLLGSFLPSFATTELRGDEVVHFSYGKWRRVSLRHHIFCYQPSPKTSKFSTDESPSNGLAAKAPSSVELSDEDGKTHKLGVIVLAAEQTWQTPTLLLAEDSDTEGRALFSQVHLEMDATEKQEEQLQSVRLEVFSDLLSSHLGLQCNKERTEATYSTAYFLGKHDKKLEFLEKLSSHLEPNKSIKLKSLTLQFCGKGEKATAKKAAADFLPISLYDCPQNFSTVEYFDNLKTSQLGRLVVYSEVLTSSMELLSGPILEHGFVVIPRQQTAGVGRGRNAWISPDGCAMFSIQLHIPLHSKLGQRLSLLQHILALSVVSAVCSQPGYEKLDLGLKWPNDIYAGGNAKIGGLVINSSLNDGIAVCNAGCAVNLNNKLPTTCINDLIRGINCNTGSKLEPLSLEKYFALVFTELEKLLNCVLQGDMDIVFDLYYKYWLHSFSEVNVVSPEGNAQKATIIGLDDYGFLKVRGESGHSFTVHPDGNSFNMLSGLIAPK